MSSALRSRSRAGGVVLSLLLAGSWLSGCAGGGGAGAADAASAGRLTPRPSVAATRGGPMGRSDCEAGVALLASMFERVALGTDPVGDRRRAVLELEIAEGRQDVPEPLLGVLEEADGIMRRTASEVQDLAAAMQRGERPYSHAVLVEAAQQMEERMRVAQLDERFEALCPRPPVVGYRPFAA